MTDARDVNLLAEALERQRATMPLPVETVRAIEAKIAFAKAWDAAVKDGGK